MYFFNVGAGIGLDIEAGILVPGWPSNEDGPIIISFKQNSMFMGNVQYQGHDVLGQTC